jgi:ubiquinone/menaquinone biosynthesis C-methylase UbiE
MELNIKSENKISTIFIRLSTRLRDTRIVWDVMGSLYNRGIHNLLDGLFESIAQELIIRNNGKILEVGAGRGDLSLLLASRNPDAHVTGVDYSLMQVRRAESYRRRKKINNCSFQQNDVLSLQFKDETFDAAVSVGSIKHWSDSHQGLMELHRVLKPGCCLMIAETDKEVSDADLQKFVKAFRVPFIPEKLLFQALRNVVFGQSFSQDELAGAVNQAGFRKVECQRVADCPYVIAKAWK